MKTTTLSIVAFTAALGFGAALLPNGAAPRAAEPVAQPAAPLPESYAILASDGYREQSKFNGSWTDRWEEVKACSTPGALVEWLKDGIRDPSCVTLSTFSRTPYRITIEHRKDVRFAGRYFDFVTAGPDGSYYVLSSWTKFHADDD